MKPRREQRHLSRRISRRDFLLAAAGTCGVALSGCGPTITQQGPVRLSVLVIGFVGEAGRPLVNALQAAADSYVAAHRGRIALEVTTTPVPPSSWYSCGSVGSDSGCSPTGGAGLGFANSAQPIVTTATGGLIAVQGRTALDIRFGSPDHWPKAVDKVLAPPDIVIGYDVWAFWLGLFAAQLDALWKTSSDDRAGIPDSVQRHGQIFCPGRGTVFAALPLLRSPMGLLASKTVASGVLGPLTKGTTWTWDSITAALQAAPFSIDTGPFSVGAADGAETIAQPAMAAEATASLITSYGGQIATATPGSAALALAQPSAVQGLQALVALRATDRQQVQGTPFFRPHIAPAYLWEPLGGGILSIWARNSGDVYYPWASGPSRRAVPASYLCAYLWQGGPRSGQAGDFCAYLLSSDVQRVLAQGGGGFALRPSDAVYQLTATGAPMAFPELAVDSTADITLMDLYGAWKTDQNALAMDQIADAFVAALGPINDELPAPTDLPPFINSAYQEVMQRPSEN
jgi:hypothetical protein